MLHLSVFITPAMTRDEFEDAARRICKEYSLPLNDDAMDYVFSLSNGHPGAVTGIICHRFAGYLLPPPTTPAL
jgi:hypothetical protein